MSWNLRTRLFAVALLIAPCGYATAHTMSSNADVTQNASSPSSLRAYIGRSPDGRSFWGFVTDAAREAGLREEGGPWVSVDEALEWARLRASEVVLTYAFSEDSVFSAGREYFPGEETPPLPVWPPEPSEVARLDIEAMATGTDQPTPADRLGVDEPEVRD